MHVTRCLVLFIYHIPTAPLFIMQPTASPSCQHQQRCTIGAVDKVLIRILRSLEASVDMER